MIRLNLLGEIGLVDGNGERIQPVLQQPKRLAVLAYLALDGAPSGPRRRDKALLLFWPDATEKHARNALSQTTHFLRRWLGASVVVDFGPGELGLDPGALWCDAVAFRMAADRGDWEGALDLYRGDLLAGLAISAGPEFEQWMDEQRNELRRTATRAAWKLAEAAGTQHHEAVRWGRRAVELSKHDERAVQRLLHLLDRLDDPAGALEAYDDFAGWLVRECQATPSIQTRQMAAAIRSRWNSASPIEQPQQQPHRVSPVVPTEDSERTSSAPAELVVPGAADPPRSALPIGQRIQKPYSASHAQAFTTGKRWVWAVGFASCLLVSLALSRTPRDTQLHDDESTRVVVQTLADIDSTPRSAALGTALTSAIIDQLVHVRSFEVASERRSVSQLPEVLPGRGQEFLVTGDVIHSGERIHVDVTVTDALSNRIVRTGVFEQTVSTPLPVVDTLSHQIASLVRTAAGDEAQMREWRKYTGDEHVYDLMRRANDERDRASNLERIGNFQTAAKALEAADSVLRDVELATPDWSTPLVERAELSKRLATLYMIPLRDPERGTRLLVAGIREGHHAVALHSNDASALTSLGSLYYWYWLTEAVPRDSAARTLVRAEANLRAAVATDPNNAAAWDLLSASLYARADYSSAYLAANRAYASDMYLQDSQDILNRLFLTSYEIGDDSASARWCDEVRRRFVHSWTSAYCQLALLAWLPSGRPGSVRTAWTIEREGEQESAQLPATGARLQMLVAAVVARNGLRDSAEAVIKRARSVDANDDEILPLEADARIALNERYVARQLVTQYVAERPLHRMGVAHSRRFAALSSLGPTPR